MAVLLTACATGNIPLMGTNRSEISPALSGKALRVALREVLGRFIDLNSHDIFIFGSEASPERNDRADIDIGILGPHPLAGALMQNIRYELETLRTLRKFDVIDFSRVDPSFRSIALQHVERL